MCSCVAVRCSVLQCVAVCCSVLQCVRCSVSLSSLLGTNVTHSLKVHMRMCVCMEFIRVNICVWLHARDELILCMTQTVTSEDVKRDLHICKETYEYSIYVYGGMKETKLIL